MSSASSYKKNHYVPTTYLKRWKSSSSDSSSNEKIFNFNIKDKLIREVPLKKQCQKKNLYDTPNDFPEEHRKTIEWAFLGHLDNVFSKIMSNTFDQNIFPDSGDINDLVIFVIYQSFRTPKFKNELIRSMRNVKVQNPKLRDTPEEYSYNLVYLFSKIMPELLSNCYLEILVNKSDRLFVTSDNPSTYWIIENGNSYLVNSLISNWKKKNIRLLCPISPKICFICHFNILEDLKLNIHDRKKTFPHSKKEILREEVKLLNITIKSSADKSVFSNDKKWLEELL